MNMKDTELLSMRHNVVKMIHLLSHELTSISQKNCHFPQLCWLISHDYPAGSIQIPIVIQFLLTTSKYIPVISPKVVKPVIFPMDFTSDPPGEVSSVKGGQLENLVSDRRGVAVELLHRGGKQWGMWGNHGLTIVNDA